MTRHALVKDGAILEYRSEAPNVDQSKLAAGKPRLLPVETIDPAFDPETQVRSGPVYEFQAEKVVERYTVRAKTAEEKGGFLAALVSRKDAAIEAEFERRHSAPIAFVIDGASYDWHADAKAVENIMGLGILAVGALAQNPRNWTPVGSATPVANVNVLHLGAAIAARRDALFTIKKAKQAEVASLTDPAEVAAYDVAAGW